MRSDFFEGNPLAVAKFGNDQDRIVVGFHQVKSDNPVAFLQVNPANALGLSSHRANFIFLEPNDHTFRRRQQNFLVAVRPLNATKFVAFRQRDCLHAFRQPCRELAQRRLFDRPVARRHEQVTAIVKVGDGHGGDDLLVGIQLQELSQMCPFRFPASRWDFVGAQLVAATFVAEEEQSVAC